MNSTHTTLNPYDTAEVGETPAQPHADLDNPYLSQAAAAPSVNLDAGAPQLRSAEMQRINRKALAFLGGMLLLLVIMAAWIFGKGGDPEKKAARTSGEQISVPELPQAATAAPVPLAEQRLDSADAADYPPLPPAQPVAMDSGYAAAGSSPSGFDDAPRAARMPTLLERRMGAEGDAVQGGGSGGAQNAQDAYIKAMMATMQPQDGQGAAAGQPVRGGDAKTSARYLERPDTLLVRGTFIRCVLETHIVTDVPGFTSCVVTEPVYSINGRSLLLPRGSKVLGRYQDDVTGNRVSVIWDRVLTPGGVDVNMSSPGVDNLGGAGHPGDSDAHWGSRITSALLISVLSDAFKYAAAKNGPPSTVAYGNNVVQTPFESNTARTVQNLADQAIDAAGRRKPTVTINQGTVVNVYVARDIDFSGVVARR